MPWKECHVKDERLRFSPHTANRLDITTGSDGSEASVSTDCKHWITTTNGEILACRGAAGGSTGTGVTVCVGATSPSAELFLEEFHLCGSQNFSNRSLKRFSPGVQLLAHVQTNLTELLALRLEQCFKALGLFIAKIE